MADEPEAPAPVPAAPAPAPAKPATRPVAAVPVPNFITDWRSMRDLEPRHPLIIEKK